MSTATPINRGGRPLTEAKRRQPLHVSVSADTADYIAAQVVALTRKPPMPKPHGGHVLDLMRSFCQRNRFDAAQEKREPVSTPAPAKPLPRHRG